MNKTEIEEIKNIFDSIICLAVEGPDATSIRSVINKIIKEAGRGYNLCDRHLTPAAPDSEGRCPECVQNKDDDMNYCANCGRKFRRQRA